MKYKVYILFSSTLDRYYIGYTGDDLIERVRRHLSDHKGLTAKAKDWRLMHFEEYTIRKDAYKRERQLKAWKSRKKIEDLITVGRELAQLVQSIPTYSREGRWTSRPRSNPAGPTTKALALIRKCFFILRFPKICIPAGSRGEVQHGCAYELIQQGPPRQHSRQIFFISFIINFPKAYTTAQHKNWSNEPLGPFLEFVPV